MHSIFRLFSDDVVGFFFDIVFYYYTEFLHEKPYKEEKRQNSNCRVNHNREKSVKENLSALVVLPYCIEKEVMKHTLNDGCRRIQHNNIHDMPPHEEMKQQ